MLACRLLRKEFFVAALCVSGAAASAQAPAAASVSIEPPAGAHVLLTAHGKGAQIYTCTDGHWALKAPDAKLFDDSGLQVGTHFAGPTWRLTDGSLVKGKLLASQPSPDAASVPWLLLEAVPGSASGHLAEVMWVRRTHTQGGKAPADACTEGVLSVPYTADYSFYTR